METAGNNSQVISQALPLSLVLYIFKLVLSIIISNQIKYYLARNRGNFLQIKYGFFRHALPLSAMMACYWKSTYQELKKINAWNMNVWRIMVECHKVRFVSLTAGAEIVNVQRSDNGFGIWLAGTNTLTQSHFISNHSESLQRFQGRSQF